MRRSRPQFLEPPSPLPPNLSYVLGISPSAMTLGLGNMRRLTSALGHPERRFRSVVVAGTNGKGSVTSYLAAILATEGVRAGCYTSPHVYEVTERIRIDGEAISLDEMEAAAARIVPFHEAIGFSYFEALTAIAFITFAERGVDVAVLETGLGGRFDATNVVDPKVSVITSIGLDHRRILGDTEEEIILEKLGIARGGVPLLTGPLKPALDAIVTDRARRDGIPRRPMTEIGKVTSDADALGERRIHVETPLADYGTVPLPFAGVHQQDNALLSIAAAESILGRPLTRLAEAAGRVRMPARFEVSRYGDKRVILDVAHNDDALIASMKTLASVSERSRCALVLGLLARKELDRFPPLVSEYVSRMHFIQPVEEESLDASQLLGRFGLAAVRDRGTDVVLERRFDDEAAWDRFIQRLLDERYPCDTILITGSHRTVEQVGLRLHRRRAA